MRQIVNRYNALHDGLFGSLQKFDGLGPLALRLYLVPVFWVAGTFFSFSIFSKLHPLLPFLHSISC